MKLSDLNSNELIMLIVVGALFLIFVKIHKEFQKNIIKLK